MSTQKVLNIAIIVVAVLMIAPLPLAYWVDLTYHWLLIVTIPAGILLIVILVLIKAFLQNKAAKEARAQSNN